MSDLTFNKNREPLGVQRHEDGYLRCGWRLGRQKIPFDLKEPILLPDSRQFADLKGKIWYNGVAEIRSIFWISKGKQTIKPVIRSACCVKDQRDCTKYTYNTE